MKRNRIVIDLDQARADQQGRGRARRSGRAGRIFGIIAVVLVLIVIGVSAGGYFWWRHYQSGPAYSLALLADAAQRNDSATADGILDTEKITSDFVSQVRQRLPATSSASSLLPSQLDPLKTLLSAKLKETVHDQLMKELKELTSVAAGKPFVIVALAIPYFADIKQDNSTAQVNVNIKEQQIKITMQADGERWRITAVQDEKLAKMVADSMIRSVPANDSQLQDSIRKQLEGLK